MDMLIPIAHPATVRIQHVIEHSAVTFLNGLQFAQVVRKQAEMECIHLRLLGDLLGNVVVVGYGMVSVLHAEERITERAEFARQHECLNARHVALESERLQVEH